MGLISYARDRYGFRGKYKSTSPIVVLTIGVSTTNPLYIDDKKARQAVLLDEFYRSGRSVEVVDASVHG